MTFLYAECDLSSFMDSRRFFEFYQSCDKEKLSELFFLLNAEIPTSLKVSTSKQCICLYQDCLDVKPIFVEGMIGINQGFTILLQTKIIWFNKDNFQLGGTNRPTKILR